MFGVIATLGCTNFLHEEPKVGVNADSYLNSYDKATTLLGASYAKLGDREDGVMGRERFMMPTDLHEGNQDAGRMILKPTSFQVRDLWRKLYGFIATANVTIREIESKRDIIDQTFVNSNREDRTFISLMSEREGFKASNMLLGEVKFMRAYAYFTLYRYFGGVPILTNVVATTPEFKPRATRDELFAFLENELTFAKDNCVPNKINGVETLLYGRVTQGAAAGLLAKAYVFQASYIRRAGFFNDKIGELPGTVSREELYDKAILLCDSLINQQIGQHQLENYYPAVFTKANSEVLFSVVASQGTTGGLGIGNNEWGTEGSAINGAQGGRGSTKWHALLYDLPTWGSTNEYSTVPKEGQPLEYGSTYKGMAEAWGALEKGNPRDGFDRILPKTMENQNSLSFTGDSTRRMWNVVKMFITGSDPDQNFHQDLADGMWIFEPFGKYTKDENGSTLSRNGRDYFISPLKGDEYSTQELNILTEYTNNNQNAIGIWKEEKENDGTVRTIFDSDLFRMPRQWRFSKFRRPHPSSLPDSFLPELTGVDYPILRLAEMHLLKAEALYFKGNTSLAIAELNKVRDRARNHATNFVDLFDLDGDAPYSYATNRPIDIPTSLTGEQALREILLERVRELCGEDDCRWFDLSRYPDLHFDNTKGNHVYYNLNSYRDPYSAGVSFYQREMEDRINTTNLAYKVLLPIPLEEFQYFPDLRQNPGY